MISDELFSPNINETPTQYADRLSVKYAGQTSTNHRKSLGQYFTPLPVAQFLANLASSTQSSIRILDPGCGIGILSSALCEHLSKESKNVKEIAITAFEADLEILPFAERCFAHLQKWLKGQNIEFTYFLCKNDFVLHNSHLLSREVHNEEEYDIVISNPPYFKLPKGDERIEASKSVIHGQTNIYSIFMIIAAKLLKTEGKLIFITPRSFCSGSYFRLFREVFFDLIELELVHLFNSRNEAFKRDKVLQENIIVVGIRKKTEVSTQMRIAFGPEMEQRITISFSEGIADISCRREKSYVTHTLVNLNSYQKTLYLPINRCDEQILEQFSQWTGSFENYGLKVSTGPVVDFRNLNFISHQPKQESVPLMWLHNVFPLKIHWPSTIEKGKSKGQYIICNAASRSKLVTNRNYVLLRRFSSKDDKSRLVAAPYLRNDYPHSEMIGIENHLNYIYYPEKELTQDEAMGISVLLNSRLFDLYFRIFNGNINVSATELRNFPLPGFELIIKLGRHAITKLNKNGYIDVDNMVKSIFKLNLAIPQTEWTK